MKKISVLVFLAFCLLSCKKIPMEPNFDDAALRFSHTGDHGRDCFHAEGDTAYIHFSFVSTKAEVTYVHTMPAVDGRAVCEGEVISTTSNRSLAYFSAAKQDTVSHYWPHGDIYLFFEIPANPGKEKREISFEYSVQENRLFNLWSDWQFITSAFQEGQ